MVILVSPSGSARGAFGDFVNGGGLLVVVYDPEDIVVLNTLTQIGNRYLESPIFLRGARRFVTEDSGHSGVFDPRSDMGRWFPSYLAGLAAR